MALHLAVIKGAVAFALLGIVGTIGDVGKESLPNPSQHLAVGA